jgi:hypothetical protein
LMSAWGGEGKLSDSNGTELGEVVAGLSVACGGIVGLAVET